MWSIIVAIFVGFFAGLIARALHPGNNKAGFWMTTLLGIAGSLLSTISGRILGFYQDGAAAGFIASIVGAIIILTLYQKLILQKTSE